MIGDLRSNALIGVFGWINGDGCLLTTAEDWF